ncbi:hypothetical protein TTHERM_000648878 (macronuclear) [Tetrahymena thermophila SB210]|uniref:Kinase domain protein n=1 Tax=Tetrahymena thermophila (strain SB210) TaxID=312017 RepID=W7XCL5_TETTS|nr:hypothetical protein TTHERM_000648878 [Tetrahymena thermophila SB210]EWS74288.1 hypothetical protein TTHERM_000648878 [Tetrahymena thermophila SB210]|eukprot:XP_012653176.1 hypothetical protein TTHERM_000648878 [Tetrahymena thermophila SB210]
MSFLVFNYQKKSFVNIQFKEIYLKKIFQYILFEQTNKTNNFAKIVQKMGNNQNKKNQQQNDQIFDLKNYQLFSNKILQIESRFYKQFDYQKQRSSDKIEEYNSNQRTLFLQIRPKKTIGEQQASDFAAQLSECKDIIASLDLQFELRKLGDQAIVYLGDGLSQCKNLKCLTLNLSQNIFGSESFNGLIDKLSNCQNLFSLNIFLGGNSNLSKQILFIKLRDIKNLFALKVKLPAVTRYIVYLKLKQNMLRQFKKLVVLDISVVFMKCQLQ